MVPALSLEGLAFCVSCQEKKHIGHPGLGGFGSPKVLLTCWGSGILPIFIGFSIYIVPAAGFLKITSCNFVTKPQQMMERINNNHHGPSSLQPKTSQHLQLVPHKVIFDQVRSHRQVLRHLEVWWPRAASKRHEKTPFCARSCCVHSTEDLKLAYNCQRKAETNMRKITLRENTGSKGDLALNH